jgi:MFS family permease
MNNYNPAIWDWGYLLGQAAMLGLKIFGAVLIFVAGYYVVSFVAKMLDRALNRIGFDRMIERGGIKQAMQGTGTDPSMLLSKIIFYTLMIFVTAFALNVFGPNPISDIFSRFIAFFPNILVSIAIVVIAAAIGSVVRDLVKGAIGGLSYGNGVATASYVGILVLGAFMALTQLNIAMPIIVGLWYAMLALAVGVGIVAIGGGGIKPMEERWRRTLDKADHELPRVKEQFREGSFAEPQRYAQQGMNQPGVVYPQNVTPRDY